MCPGPGTPRLPVFEIVAQVDDEVIIVIRGLAEDPDVLLTGILQASTFPISQKRCIIALALGSIRFVNFCLTLVCMFCRLWKLNYNTTQYKNIQKQKMQVKPDNAVKLHLLASVVFWHWQDEWPRSLLRDRKQCSSGKAGCKCNCEVSSTPSDTFQQGCIPCVFSPCGPRWYRSCLFLPHHDPGPPLHTPRCAVCSAARTATWSFQCEAPHQKNIKIKSRMQLCILYIVWKVHNLP